jgi:hypothetical protein
MAVVKIGERWSCGRSDNLKFEPQCKTKADLHEQYARVLRMCDGTVIRPDDCVKYDGMIIGRNIDFTVGRFNQYEFAIAIVEGRPVFRGDKLFRQLHSFVAAICLDGKCLVDTDGNKHYLTLCSWNPPKPKEERPSPSITAKQFNEAAKPLIKWLNDNCNPHSMIVVEPDGAVLHFSELCYRTSEFLKD